MMVGDGDSGDYGGYEVTIGGKQTKVAKQNVHTHTHTHETSTFRDKYLCNYMNDIVFCGSPHIKIMNNGFGYFTRMQKKRHQTKTMAMAPVGVSDE